MRYQAVLFDLDGTLADTLYDLTDALGAALLLHGLEAYDAQRVKMLVGTGWENLIRGALREKAGDQKLAKSVGEAFKAHYDAHFMDKTAAYEGIPALLDALRANGVGLGVVTNKRRYMARLVLERLFGDKIRVVYGPGDGVPGKPDPCMPRLAMRDLHAPPERTLFVGDSAVDILTAKAAGTASAGVLWGFRGEAELKSAGADHIVGEPAELLEIVGITNLKG